MAAAVTIVINGSIVAGVAPARITAGRVVAPLTPIVVRIASRVVYDPAVASVLVERAGRRIVVPVAFVEDDVPYVELAAVVQRLGGSAVFDAQTKTLVVELRISDPIETPTPFDPALPQAGPTTVFTPAPPRATPRRDDAVPRPRRTAIPVVPSEPIVPPGALTSRRRLDV